MKSKTETLSAALRILANDIQSPDDVPATCLREAADRLEELQRELEAEEKKFTDSTNHYNEIIILLARERDEALAELETRKEALLDAVEQIEGLKTSRDTWYERAKRYEKERDEPSRLEIAALILANNTSYDGPERALQRADDLIEAAKKGAK